MGKKRIVKIPKVIFMSIRNGYKCSVDGTVFDYDGTCSHGHQAGDLIEKR